MIKTICNNSFMAQHVSGMKREENKFFTDDRVILSGLISDGRKKPGINLLQEENFSRIPADQLIIHKEVELRCLENNLSSLEDIHRSIHEYNICGDELQKIHEKINSLKDKIKDVTSDIRKLRLKTIEPYISPLPKEVSNYYKKVNFDISPEEIDKIGNIYKELSDDRSPIKIKGNSINTLEGEEIWREMNRMLDIKEGSPSMEIDVEYYLLGHKDIYNKLKKAAKNGHKIRVIIDPGTGLKTGNCYCNKDVSEYLDCLTNLISLREETEDTNFAFTVAKKESLKNLMHRKFLRVGEKVLIGGMNCDKGSGENADYAMVIEGPETTELTSRFQEDITNSAGKTIRDIFGKDIELLKHGYITDGQTGEPIKYRFLLTPSQFCDFLILLLPAESQKYIENAPNGLDRVIRIFEEYKKSGLNPEDYGEFKEANNSPYISDTPFMANLMNEKDDFYAGLTDKGRTCLYKKLEESFNHMNLEKNLGYLKDITLPEGNISGTQTLVTGTTHEELQALVIYAINSAEEFLYIPSFCMSKDISELIIEKKKSMEKLGKHFDIKILLEPSEMPANNINTCLNLKEAGIPVRFARLDGTGENHDRKLHSKMIVSDKVLFTGSTNLTHSGLRENQETSVMVFIDPLSDRRNMEEYKKDFLELWEGQSVDVNLSSPVSDIPVFMSKEEYEKNLVRKTVRNIGRYERTVGNKIKNIAESREDVKEEIQRLKDEGFHDGYARLLALKKFYTEDEINSLRIAQDYLLN
ncbi:MAG: phospholipase D-like domain-containing protein [Candidatus Eremiobacterota bacterium]